MDYKISEKACRENHIFGVCSRCRGEIKPMETVDNSGDPTFWAGCSECNVFDCGVPERIYDISEKLVDSGHIEYSHMDTPFNKDDAYKKYWRETQIGGTCSLVRKVLQIAKSFD